MECLTAKYLDNLVDDIYSYSKMIEPFYKIGKNGLWDDYKVISKDVIEIIKEYVESDYYTENKNVLKPVLYFNDHVLKMKEKVKEHYNNNEKEYTGEIALLSIILESACYFRKISELSLVSKDYTRYIENLFKGLNKIAGLNVEVPNKTLNDINKMCVKSAASHKGFFDSLKGIELENKFLNLNKQERMYEVVFTYPKDKLKEYNNRIVTDYENKYKSRLLQIGYQLLGINILKDYMNNNEKNVYLVRIPLNYLNKESELEVFDYPVLKKHIKFLVAVEDYVKNVIKIKELMTKGFDFVFEVSDTDYRKVSDKHDITALVSNEFIEKNRLELDELKKKKINLVIKESSKILDENEMVEREK